MSTIWEVGDADEEIEGLDASGKGDPAYAAALGLIPAPYGRRSLAVAIDVAIYLIVQIPYWIFSVPLLLLFVLAEITAYGLVNHPNFFLAALMAGITALLTLALLIVQGVFQGLWGVTIGKAIVGIRSINTERLGKPGFWRIVLRTLIVGASNIVPLVGPALFFLSALRDHEKRGRSWHDHAAHVWLIDIREGLNPYDDKRMRIARKLIRVEIAPRAEALPSLATAADGGAPPEYRPAHSVGAGVLGVAKARRGGYRTDGSASPVEAQDHRVVLGVPAEIAAAPQAPAAPEPVHAGAGARDEVLPSHPLMRPAEAIAPQPQPQGAVRLILDAGGEYVLTAPAVFGRQPEGDAGYGGAECVPIADDTRSVSKTHFALRPLPEGIEVRDLGSTNGTWIVRGGVESPVVPEAPLMAVPGDVVRFGDRTMMIDAV